jgi:hypothetical protein
VQQPSVQGEAAVSGTVVSGTVVSGTVASGALVVGALGTGGDSVSTSATTRSVSIIFGIVVTGTLCDGAVAAGPGWGRTIGGWADGGDDASDAAADFGGCAPSTS